MKTQCFHILYPINKFCLYCDRENGMEGNGVGSWSARQKDGENRGGQEEAKEGQTDTGGVRERDRLKRIRGKRKERGKRWSDNQLVTPLWHLIYILLSWTAGENCHKSNSDISNWSPVSLCTLTQSYQLSPIRLNCLKSFFFFQSGKFLKTF